MEEDGENARPTRSVEVHRRRRKNGQSSEGRSEARKRKWQRDDAGRLVSPFFLLFLFTLAPFLSLLFVFSVPAPRSKIKVSPCNSERNYFGSLSSSLYLSFRANSR